jgi:hypothetical protein
MPLLAPRVLYLGPAIPSGLFQSIATNVHFPADYDAEGNPRFNWSLRQVSHSYNPAYDEHQRVLQAMIAVAGRARAAMPDLYVRVTRTMEHTQTNIAGQPIAGRQYDHMLCPPTTEKGGRYIGPRFLNVWVGGSSIGNANDNLVGYQQHDYDLIPENVARIAERQGYLAGYAARVWCPEPSILDGLEFSVTADPGVAIPPAYYEAEMQYLKPGRIEVFRVAHPTFMEQSTEAMAAAGIDARYMGPSSSATEASIAAVVSEFFGVDI